uniref:USP domain-containing protein n=1 Tax=Knipowitschia caucasica TaxID=637954 RepID=A0AAV2J6G9_KNICA
MFYLAHGFKRELPETREKKVLKQERGVGHVRGGVCPVGGVMVIFTDWLLSPVIPRSTCGSRKSRVPGPMSLVLFQRSDLSSALLSHKLRRVHHTLHKSSVPVPVDAQNISLDKADKVENASKTLHTIDSQEESSQGSERDGENHCTNTVSLDGISSLPDGDVSPPPAQTEATIEPMLSAENTVALTDYVVNSEIKDISPEEKLVPAPVEIFWRNKKNLCWLDSLLVALVNLKSLRNLKPPAEPQQSPVWRVLSTCDEANAAIQSQQQPDKDGSMKVPRQLLKTVNTTLETLRMSVFDLLQPKLQCKLGQKESPVFALPLLLKLDPWLESSFQASFRWDFRCSSCKSSTRENLVKTLPSFTNIVPDWHPLRASHLAPCNNCHQKNQRRRMVLQGASPVFVLHFVEGLPDNNIQVYNFNFKKRHYSVTAVIQYSSHQEHFVTWVHRSDGSWLEFDDLKHPHCTSHQTFPVPAQEIHIVFWEEEQRQESRACSPSSTSTETPLSTNRIHPSVKDLDNIAQELFQSSPDQSLLHPQNTSDIVDGISEQDASIMAEVDTTIGYKLLKKLKAKKKKLAQLNEMLGEARPDSTNAFSPGSVTSSTLDDEFLSDLFSPATTVTSTRSPDSTDFLEMLANGQEASVSMEMSQSTQMQQNTGMETNDFLDEFMSQAVAERPGEMEEDPLMELGVT